jgi:hypothetical protein
VKKSALSLQHQDKGEERPNDKVINNEEEVINTNNNKKKKTSIATERKTHIIKSTGVPEPTRHHLKHRTTGVSNDAPNERRRKAHRSGH